MRKSSHLTNMHACDRWAAGACITICSEGGPSEGCLPLPSSLAASRVLSRTNRVSDGQSCLAAGELGERVSGPREQSACPHIA